MVLKYRTPIKHNELRLLSSLHNGYLIYYPLPSRVSIYGVISDKHVIKYGRYQRVMILVHKYAYHIIIKLVYCQNRTFHKQWCSMLPVSNVKYTAQNCFP